MKSYITVLYPVTDLAMDGAQRQLLELVRGLDKTRFKPIVLTLHRGGVMDAEFSEVPELELISLNQKGKYDLLCLLKVFNIIRNRKVDVIQPFLTPATFYGLLPAILGRTPVKIVTERLGPGRGSATLGYRFYLKVEDMLSRFADWAIPNSKSGEEFLIQRGMNPKKVQVIHNGINLERLTSADEDVSRVRHSLGAGTDGKVVGITARLFPQKRHDAFLRTANIINQSMPVVRYAIVGNGPLKRDLEELSQKLGLDQKVTFCGEQPGVGSFISAFDVAVMTSETEGCSNSILEAMALGKPVVATDVGGNGELINHGDTGFLIPLGDEEALAEAIMTLLQDTERAQAMGRRAKQKVDSQFSVSNMVRRYQNIYEATLNEKKRNDKDHRKSNVL